MLEVAALFFTIRRSSLEEDHCYGPAVCWEVIAVIHVEVLVDCMLVRTPRLLNGRAHERQEEVQLKCSLSALQI